MSTDVIEFWLDDACIASAQSSIVPPKGAGISIRNVVYDIKSVSFALDHADGPMRERRMRTNVELKKR